LEAPQVLPMSLAITCPSQGCYIRLHRRQGGFDKRVMHKEYITEWVDKLKRLVEKHPEVCMCVEKSSQAMLHDDLMLSVSHLKEGQTCTMLSSYQIINHTPSPPLLPTLNIIKSSQDPFGFYGVLTMKTVR
jgi:hypothetical protein